MVIKLIKIKGIIPDIFNDAPFIGTLLVANSCNLQCKDCLNEHLKKEKPNLMTVDNIFKEVSKYPLTQGIIFGGLEWSEQPEDLIELVKYFTLKNYKIIIYTGLTKDKFNERCQNLFFIDFKNDFYIKYGKYNNSLKTDENIHFGINLASKNQYIVKYN